jgi:hypothetical protein
MTELETSKPMRAGVKVALVAAGLAVGAIGATALSANATTSGTGSTTPGYTAAGAQTAPANAPDPRGAGGPPRSGTGAR